MGRASIAQRVGIVVTLAVAVAACSDTTSGEGSKAGTDLSSPSDSSNPDSTGDAPSTTLRIRPTTTTAAGDGPSTTVAGSSGSTIPGATTPTSRTTVSQSTVPRTTTPGATAPPVSDPFATGPDPGPDEPDDLPGPPTNDCLDAPAGSSFVEITFDDDNARYSGALDPSCVRIHGAQRLKVRSTGEIASSVYVGDDVYQLAAGASLQTDPLGTMFAVGDVFDLYLEQLDITVLVQVLP